MNELGLGRILPIQAGHIPNKTDTKCEVLLLRVKFIIPAGDSTNSTTSMSIFQTCTSVKTAGTDGLYWA